jgi:hypothetical protein
MVAIQNQQTSLLYFISLNSTELTEGTRRCSIAEMFNVSDIETSSGRIKRFFAKNKKVISVSYSYIGSGTDHTVDGRVGRDFIYNLALNTPSVQVAYVDENDGPTLSFQGYISNYKESIIRRELSSQCIYYSLDFDIEEK